jgi:predicted aspartyl protease
MTTFSRFLQSSMDRASADIASEVLRSRGPIVKVAVHGPLGTYEGDGLIDTGADHTTIDQRVFEKVGLQPVGTSVGQGVTSGKMMLPLYKARLTFPGTKFPAANFDKIPSVPNLLDIGLVALIGRDVLANSNLLYRGSDGFFAMAPVSDGDKIAIGPNNPSMTIIVGSLILAVSVGAIVYMLKPEPECPPCELKNNTV